MSDFYAVMISYIMPVLVLIGFITSLVFFILFNKRYKKEEDEVLKAGLKTKRLVALVVLILFAIGILIFVGVPILFIILMSSGLIGM